MPVTVAKKIRNTASDPHDIERRLELQIHYHLLDMEENPNMYAAKERLAAIQIIGMWLNRKYGWGDDESVGAGSSVKKYSGAFRITKPSRSTPAAVDEEEAA